MEELLKLIKANLKEGADIAAIEKLAKGLNPLAGLTTVDEAKEFIKKTDLLNKALDSSISIAVKSHDDKFTAEKLPGLLKAEGERIRKEINPEETEEQKTIREQKERIDALEATGKRSELKTALQKQATELGYSGDVGIFLHLGDKAGKALKTEAERFKTAVDERVSSDIKKLYGNAPPKTNTGDPAKQMTRADYEAMSPHDQANVNLSEVTLTD